MDNGRDSGNVIEVIGGDGPRNGASNWADQDVWSPQDEYLGWDGASFFNDTTSNLIYEGRQSEPRSASEPPNRKTINVPANGSTVMGKLFFKTRLCCKFRFGTCPNINNCSFAHSIEELRGPPQNWKEIMAASADPREEYQIPSLGSSSFVTETERYKGRHCKKFYTKEGCPYGDNCTYVHDEQYKGRERVAILLGPHRAAIGNGGGGLLPTSTSAPATVSNSTLKHSNWKTRICKKWELTAYCPYGNKCIFAHGAAELHGYGDGVVAPEANPTRQGFVPSVIVAPTDSSGVARANGSKRVRRLDKITKINRIYGDWIDDTK